MRELVRDQPLTARRPGVELPGAEDDVAIVGIGLCVEGARGIGGLAVGVDAYVAEIAPEARLELAADARRKRTPSPFQTIQ